MAALLTMGLAEAASYRLKRALLVYEADGRSPFITTHGITMRGETPHLAEGYPVTQEAARSLATSLARDLTYQGFVPANLLAIGPAALAWWIPPAKRRVWFDARGVNPEADEPDPGAKEFGKRVGTTPHPGLVMAANASNWYVWALKAETRPERDTQLCRAPYFNVWADRGQVCVGNVRLPRAIGPEAMDAYERAFFESRFTHPNNGFKVRFKGGGYALWRHLLDNPPAKFPARVLQPAGVTLEGFLKRLFKEKD